MSLRTILKLRSQSRCILMHLTWLFLFLFCIYCWLIYAWDVICWKNHKTQEIHVPCTNETLYLTATQNRFDNCISCIELTTCDWRIFKLPKHEYYFYENYVYYKVTSDTLYLIVGHPIPKPKRFKGKTKIIQVAEKEVLKRTYFSVHTEEDEKKIKAQGYCKFPTQ